MKKSDLVCVGAIAGAHGVNGDVRVRSFTSIPEDCFAYGPLLDEAGEILIEAKSARPAKTHFIVSARQNKTREDWEAMRGTRLFVPKSELPEPEEDEFYYDDLIGMAIVHQDGRDLGKVKSVQNFGSDDLLEIVAPDRKTGYYLPFTKAVVPTVNMAEKTLTAIPDESYLPEGLQRPDASQD